MNKDKILIKLNDKYVIMYKDYNGKLYAFDGIIIACIMREIKFKTLSPQFSTVWLINKHI